MIEERATSTEEAKNYAAAKVAFRGSFSGYQGLLYLLADIQERSFERTYLIVASEASVMETRPQIRWIDFEEAIYNAKFQGKTAPQISAEFERKLREKTGADLGQELIRVMERNDLSAFMETMTYEISRMIGDGEVDVKAHLERLTRREVKPVEQTSPPPEAPPAAVEPPAEGVPAAVHAAAASTAIQVKIDPILAPVSGVAVGNLLPGQGVVVKIVDTSETSMTVARLARESGTAADAAGTIVGRVLAVEPGEYDRVLLRVHLMPGVEGIVPVAKEIKIKVTQEAVPVAPAASAAAEPGDFEDPPRGLNPVILFGGFAVSLLVLILLAWGLLFR